MSFTAYESNPWAGIETNKRVFYDPFLRDWFVRESQYSRFAFPQFAIQGAETMRITQLVAPHANFDPIALRSMWMNSSYVDTKEREITFERYGGKMSVHSFEDLVTYWTNERIVDIINRGIGVSMGRTLNYLARNAMLSSPFAMYGTSGGSSFNSISTSDKLNTPLIRQINLGMAERDVPYAQNLFAQGGSDIFCITSPGALYDLGGEVNSTGHIDQKFLNLQANANPAAAVRGYVGTYQGVHFIQSNDAILYNCGPIDVQTTLAAAASAGDGSPDPTTTKVDSVYKVGQPGVAVTHYIQVADATGFEVNDRISIHIDRTSDFGVTNGADYRDGTKTDRRVVAVDSGNNRLVLDEPLMLDFTTDLGGGTYGYVTKARHIHTAVFIGGPNGVVLGVARPPRIHTPVPIDDFNSMYRISWDAFMKYQLWEPKVLEVVFLAGTNREKGPAYVS